jgi:hypothetical protein
LQHRLVRSLTLRFTVDDGGRMRCRITDALRERFWMVADAADLYRTLRAVIGGDDSPCGEPKDEGSSST